MGGIFSSPSPPAPVQEAVAVAPAISATTSDKVETRNADSIKQRRRAAASGTGRNTILAGADEGAATGQIKTLLGL